MRTEIDKSISDGVVEMGYFLMGFYRCDNAVY